MYDVGIFSATTVTTVTVPMADVSIMTPQEFVKTCEQPVAIGTAVTMMVMLPVNVIGMFTMFTKIDKMFNPSHVLAKQRATRKF